MTDSSKLTIIAIGTSLTGLVSLIALIGLAFFVLVAGASLEKFSSEYEKVEGKGFSGATSEADLAKERAQIERQLNSRKK